MENDIGICIGIGTARCVEDETRNAVSFAKETYKRDDFLQKRPSALRG